MSTEIEVNNCYDFLTKYENLLLSLFNLQPFNLQPKDFLMFYQLLLKYFNVVFCILKCLLILWMWNVKFNHKTFFLHFV